MIQKLRSNPDAVILASDYKKIGDSIELNRERIKLTFLSISQSNTSSVEKKLDEIVEGGVTPAEKEALAREYDALQRDFGILKQETDEADLGNSDEYRYVLESYERLCALFEKIIKSSGTYTDSDSFLLSDYYTEFSRRANALESAILNVQTNEAIINGYYAKSVAYVNIVPQSVAVNTTCTISSNFLYDGNEVIDDIDESCIAFGITGLANSVTSSMFILDTTTYPEATVTVQPLTNSAVVENCKEFELKYEAIGENGIEARVIFTLDSGSMPF